MLYRCPDCDQNHRGRSFVCRPCARIRMRSRVACIVQNNMPTVDKGAEQLAADVSSLVAELAVLP